MGFSINPLYPKYIRRGKTNNIKYIPYANNNDTRVVTTPEANKAVSLSEKHDNVNTTPMPIDKPTNTFCNFEDRFFGLFLTINFTV